MDSYDELIEKTIRKECKYSLALESTLLHAVVGKYCGRLVLTGEPFIEDTVAFVLPRRSPLTLKMSNATLQLRAEGALRSFQEYLPNQEQCSLRSSPKLTFTKLRIFFFVAFSVCFLVFLEMVIDPQTAVSESAHDDSEKSSDGTNNLKFRNDLEGANENSAQPFGNLFQYWPEEKVWHENVACYSVFDAAEVVAACRHYYVSPRESSPGYMQGKGRALN